MAVKTFYFFFCELNSVMQFLFLKCVEQMQIEKAMAWVHSQISKVFSAASFGCSENTSWPLETHSWHKEHNIFQ